MRDTVLSSVFVPAALAVLMLGVGLGLELGDFRRVARSPRAMLLGLIAQLLLLPALGTAVALLTGLAAPMALGLVLLTLCPGGALSNAICQIARADVALSVSLTALASLVTPLSLPLLYRWAGGLWPTTAQALSLPIGTTTARLVGISIAPVAIGMLVRRSLGERAQRSERPVRVVSTLLLVVVIGCIVAQDFEALQVGLKTVGASVLLLNLAAVTTGLLVGWLGRASKAATVAIGIEVGMQNVATATFVSMTLLGSATMALTAAVYAFAMLPSALLLAVAGRCASPSAKPATHSRGECASSTWQT